MFDDLIFFNKESEPPQDKNVVKVVGDWVDFSHFTQRAYPQVFKAFYGRLLPSQIQFRSTPNTMSDTLIATYEEMGYKVEWTFKEWVNPEKEN